MPEKLTRGTIHACACPWCKKVHSFAGMEDYAIQEAMEGMGGIGGTERDMVFECNADDRGPGCGRLFRVAKIAKVTMLWLEPVVDRGGYKSLRRRT